MMKIPDPGRGLVRCLGLAAAAMLALSATPGERAEALSLINPGGAPSAKYASNGLATEVRGHGGHGGGGFHGGGFRGGGAASHGGGFRTAHVFHGGSFRHSGFAFRHHHRHFFHRRFYASYDDDYPYYYPHRRCRIIWTYYGPRRICHYRHWRHRWSPYW
jgi:hypothetical protein